MTLHPASTSRVVPWKNGLGTTLEIATDAALPAGPWTWRLSIADVSARAEFSHFAGIARAIACVTGAGMRLWRDGAWVEVPREGAALSFGGEETVLGDPSGEGVRDANLMVRRDLWRAEMHIVRDGSLRLDAPRVLVHAMNKTAAPAVFCDEHRGVLHPGDTLVTQGEVRVDAPDGEPCCVLACALWPRDPVVPSP